MSDATVTPSDLSALATISDYAGLLTALRQRADSLKVSRQTIDTLAGFADGYAGKVLALGCPKILGERSLGPLLEVLGLKLAVLEDPDAMERYAARRKERVEHQVRDPMLSIAGRRRREWLFSPERASECAKLRMAKLSPKRRSRLAKRAAKARWLRAREQAEAE